MRATINPIASSKQPFELKGEHARIQSHVPRPTIYIDIDEGPQSGTALADRFRLVRAEVKNDKRIVASLKVTFTGKVSEQNISVPASVEKLGTGEWVKVTPAQDLAAGEYAVVEMVGPQEMNLYVWDFGVNPNAPANPNTVQLDANATAAPNEMNQPHLGDVLGLNGESQRLGDASSDRHNPDAC